MADDPFPDSKEKPLEREFRLRYGDKFKAEIPQRYYDFSFMIAHFPAPTRRVRTLLPRDDLIAVELAPGLAVVTLGAWCYGRMASFAPYNELAIMVPVRHNPEFNVPLLPLLQPDSFDVAFWIHYLPVTTEQACAVGVSAWGYPKVVAQIEFDDVGWSHRCRLADNGTNVLTFSGPMGEVKPRRQDFFTYSLRNGELLKTRCETRGYYYVWQTPGRASFELFDHPVADDLRALEVKNFSVGGLYARGVKMRLYDGERVAAAPTTAAAPTVSELSAP